jgi:hypothetical protein
MYQIEHKGRLKLLFELLVGGARGPHATGHSASRGSDAPAEAALSIRNLVRKAD